MKLLTRDEFREGVFQRDRYRCVVCHSPAQDAHHIMERRLFPDGGYYLENGASLCEKHHREAEATLLSCDTLRSLCGIRTVVLPPHLYPDINYDKWGNPILPDGTRMKGELFHDPSVQKVLIHVLHLFIDRVRYPRTYHLPWSPGVKEDDRVMDSVASLEGQEVVVTVKMDGENVSMYRDGIHGRQLEFESHPSRSRVKALHARIQHDIPQGWRICGENLAAVRDIKYKNLDDFFLVFSIWDDMNRCLSWDETVEWAELLGLRTVPVLWRGTFDKEHIKSLYKPTFRDDECEGYVVRIADSFLYRSFCRYVGKYVRKGHRHVHGFKRKSTIQENGLKKEST